MFLIIDTRERAVLPFLDIEIKKFKYIQKQINTGDYLICSNYKNNCSNFKINACIERKTYVDFAASFRDGRYSAGIEKMKKLRDETGCQLFFFIEGVAFPSINRKFSRIPYTCILGAINKLMIKHNIFIIQTENEQHTAKRLNDLLTTYEIVSSEISTSITINDNVSINDNISINNDITINNNISINDNISINNNISVNDNISINNNISVNDNIVNDSNVNDSTVNNNIVNDNIVNDSNVNNNIVNDSNVNNSTVNDSTVNDSNVNDSDVNDNIDLSIKKLTLRIPKTSEEILIKSWSTLTGISIVLSKLLSDKYTISDIATKKISIDEIKLFKSATGKKINKDAISSILSIRTGNIILEAKLLSAVPGITILTATFILKNIGGLSSLCSYTLPCIEIILIPRGTSTIKLGEKKALMLYTLLHKLF